MVNYLKIRDHAIKHREQGAIFVLTLLSLLLIAAIVFYVFNVGKHIQGRVVTQNAADAAAMAGGTEVARTFNTIAMNNTQIVRTLASINVIDSLPQALDYTVTSRGELKDGDLTVLDTVLNYQIHREGPNDPWYKDLLLRAYQGHRGSTRTVLPQLQRLDEMYNASPERTASITFFDNPDGTGHGDLWESIYTMYQENRAMLRSLDDRMQAATWEAARTNIRSSRDAGAVMLPINLQIPIMRGHFDDFERPLKRGLLPGRDDARFIRNDSLYTGLGQVDNRIEQRGPWDTIFGWRYTDTRQASSSVSTNGPGLPPRRNQNTSTPSDGTYYRTYGPQEWMIRNFVWRNSNTIENPYALHLLAQRIIDFSSYKLGYLFPGHGQPQIRSMYKPNWEKDLGLDDSRLHDNNSYCLDLYKKEKDTHPWQFGDSMYLVCEMKSRTSNNPGFAQTKGISWNYIKRPGRSIPYVGYTESYAPEQTNGPERIQSQYIRSQGYRTPHVYEIKAEYETDPLGYENGGDSEIGLPPRIIGRNPDGTYEYAAQTVYWHIYYVFVATDIHDVREGPQPIRNPHDGFERDLESSPAPYDFVHRYMDPDNEDTHKRLQMLSVVYQDDQAEVWPERFDRERPYKNMVGISQVHLFNNHSWDLWTQMWHAQLEPVEEFGKWADEFNQGDVLDLPYTNADDVFELGRYLESMKTMSEFGRH